MKSFDYFCTTLRCKMSKEICIGRQLFSLKAQDYRVDADKSLASRGFYPECYACVRGRRLAHLHGINIGLLRRQTAGLRARVEESPSITYCMHHRICRGQSSSSGRNYP